MFQKIGAIGHRIETGCAVLLLGAIVALVAVASVSRALGSPIIWSVEIAQLCFVWLCIISADLAMQADRHFGLSLLADAIGPRLRRIVDLVNRAVLIGLLGFLLYHAWRNMQLMHPRLIGATQMHGSYLHASMVAGFCLLLRTLAAQTIAVFRNRTDTGTP